MIYKYKNYFARKVNWFKVHLALQFKLNYTDIISDTVNTKKLRKLKSELWDLLRSPQGHKPERLISIATQLGRRLDPRGKEPTYVREFDPKLSPPLSIPNHGGKDLKVGTAKNIIEVLLDDVSEWECRFNETDTDEE